jgi:ABC-type transporter Mla MlaB component
MSDAAATLRLEGSLTAREVAELERRHRARFAGTQPPERVCLADVDDVDSSALALLLEWRAGALKAGRELRVDQPPESLRVIARLTGVAPLLGWEETDTNADSAKDRS